MSSANTSIWYDKGRLLSFNCLLNYIIGNRGGGKTFAFKRWAIEDFLKNKKETMWTRRYMTELKGEGKNDGVIRSFFDDIRKEFPNVKLETKGMNGYINDEIAIHFVALSTSPRLKSKPYPNVNKIIFDEFLINKSAYHYLNGEVELLLDLVETVDRMRDETRVVMIGNALSFANPHFIYFNIKPFKDRFYHDKSRGIVVEMFTNEEFIKAKKKTRFGRLVDSTNYGDFAIENQFLLDDDRFIETRPASAKYRLGISFDGKVYGFFVDWKTGVMYASDTYDKTSKALYTLRSEDHDTNYLLVKHLRGTLIDDVKVCFETGALRFENVVIKSKVLEIIDLIL